MSRTYLGLGSNLGDRIGFLRQAVARIQQLGSVVARSAVYETAPVGYSEQGDFLNAVIAFETTLPPDALLPALKAIEKDLGRKPGPRYGPREIDLDILLMDDIVRAGDPQLPHPEMHKRAFVLRPLADIAPDLRIPGRGEVRAILASLPAGGTKLSPHVLDEL